MIRVDVERGFEAFREHARDLLMKNVRPEEILWSRGASEQLAIDLGGGGLGLDVRPVKRVKVSPKFLADAELVASAREDDRWQLIYRLLYRQQNENPNLMKVVVDDDVLRFQRLAKSVSRDIHKMHAFVRFKRILTDEGERYVAWHKPEHEITKLGAPFFMRRFGDKPWSIFTPDLSAHWDLKALTYTEGIPQSEFPHGDDMDEVWKTYYRSIFNPARLKLKAMRAEMAPKYWSSLPEAEILNELVREAPERLSRMAEIQGTQASPPANASLDELRTAARSCEACPLYRMGTHTVFGEGPERTPLMIVGEQPGDQEDQAGRPFVGPAGEVLDEAMRLAGIDRKRVYMTNAVKHFKWKPHEGREGKIRLHQKPSGSEMHACKPWLEAEIARVQPRLIILLGATAGTAILGRLPKITEERGQILHVSASKHASILSWHPSAILRSMSDEEKAQRFSQLVADLKTAMQWLSKE